MLPRLLLVLPALFSLLEESYGWRNGNKTKYKWVTEILQESLTHFAPESENNEMCNQQGTLYKQHLSNLTLWAVQMLDASASGHSGIISGSDFAFGSFDQCLRINVLDLKLRGKYCFFKIQYTPVTPNETRLSLKKIPEYQPFSSVWKQIERSSNPFLKNRDYLYWALCIPSSCSYRDLENSLLKVFNSNFNQTELKIEINVEKEFCQEANDYKKKYTTEALAVIFVLLTLIILTFGSTAAHLLGYKDDEKENKKNWTLHFSLVTNINKLFKPEGNTEFCFLSGMKVISMLLVIYGHRMFQYYYQPSINRNYQEKEFSKFSLLNFNGPIIVNTFLFITGFLTFSKIIKDIEKKRGVNIFFYIIYRWLRIVPVYLTVLVLWSYLAPYFGQGPLWKLEGPWRLESCRKNIWTHILFINNYYNEGIECLLPSWYLAVDMQLYVLSVIMGYILWKSRKAGLILLYILTILSIIIPGIITYFNNYRSFLQLMLNTIHDYWKTDDYVSAYIPTHMRAAPYFIGMATALLLNELQKNKFRFSQFQLFFGCILSTIVGISCFLVAWIFWIPERGYKVWDHTLYASLHRLAWSCTIAWIIISQITTGYGKLEKILAAKIYGPLNRLTLGVLLIHTLLQIFLFIKQENSPFFHPLNIVYTYIGDVVLSYFFAFLLYLFIEGPLGGVQDLIVRKVFLKK